MIKNIWIVIRFVIKKLLKYIIIFPSLMYNNPDKYDFERIKDELNKY